MKSSVAKCSILVGKNAVKPHAAMVEIANSLGSAISKPEWFRCLDCGSAWGGSAIPVSVDLEKVSCSNCYGDNVQLIGININVPEQWEIDGSEARPRRVSR